MIRFFGAFINLVSIVWLWVFAIGYYPVFGHGDIHWKSAKLALISVILGILIASFYRFSPSSISSLGFIRFLKWISQLPPKYVLFTLFLMAFTFFSLISLSRHYSFGSDAYDLGLFSTGIWNGLQGEGLFCSLKGNVDLLSDHFEPILYLFSPLFLLWQDTSILLVTQSFLLAISVFPLYWISQNLLKHHALSLALVASFLLSRTLKGVYITDFYPECLLVVVLFLAYICLMKQRYILFGMLLIVGMMCKEDITFTVFAFGFMSFFILRKRFLGLICMFVGVTGWIIITGYIMPSYHPEGIYEYTGRLPFGRSYWDNFVVLVTAPWKWLALLFSVPKLEYLLETFAPLGFASILGFPFFLPAAPGLLENLISPYWKQYSVHFHYGSRIIPFTYISAIYGIKFLTEKWLFKKYPQAVVNNVLAVLLLFLAFAFISVPDSRQLYKFTSKIQPNHWIVIRELKQIPKNASVVAHEHLIPHLSLRKYIYSWNKALGKSNQRYICDYVVLDWQRMNYSPEQTRIEESRLLDKGYKKLDTHADSFLSIYSHPNLDPSLVESVSGKYTEIR